MLIYMEFDLDVIIVGAGPYGLSVAAHLRALKVSFRIFGAPMQTWREHMPAGMLLKSDGFASNLSEPTGTGTLEHFCASRSLPYHHTNLPVPIETFIAYALEFQRKYVPDLDPRSVASIDLFYGGFKVTLADGETLSARSVVAAAGITHFAHMPEALATLPKALASHSSSHRNPASFRDRTVTVVGGGASAVDIAVLLHEAGARVNLVARRRAIRFHDPPLSGQRSLWQRLRNPASGLGPGLKSRLCCEAPRAFRQLPLHRRLRIVEQHLGPAPGWPMRSRLMGNVPLSLGTADFHAEPSDGGVRLSFRDETGEQREQFTEHLIAATGYRVDKDRLIFLSPGIRTRLDGPSPHLSVHFESSIPGLYFVGIAAAATFGPLMRFAYGADYAARNLSKHLARNRPSASLVPVQHAQAVTSLT